MGKRDGIAGNAAVLAPTILAAVPLRKIHERGIYGSHFLQQSVSQGFGLEGQAPPLIIVESAACRPTVPAEQGSPRADNRRPGIGDDLSSPLGR